MTSPRPYFVYEDNIMLRTQPFQLNNNQSLQFSIRSSGQTYRIEALQEANFPPLLGDTVARATIVNCNGVGTPGLVTSLPNFDDSPFFDIDCQQNIGSYDPNDKRGFPAGVGPSHFITKNTPLDYHIRFQNTGTDTAFTVVIVDTFDHALDIQTLQLGASSHPYTLNIYGNDPAILEFTFDNILLPDSNVNEPLSHGFVLFSLDQHPNNPLGTGINNQAAIYFDFNPPIFTNTTFHTIGENFIQILSVEPRISEQSVFIRVFPNPFQQRTTIEVDGIDSNRPLQLEVYNTMGQPVLTLESPRGRFEVARGDLAAGVYVFRVLADGQLQATGQFIVQ